MLPELLSIHWDETEIVDILNRRDEVRQELCQLLNNLQKPRDVRIAKLTRLGHQVFVEFGDSSALNLDLEPFLKLMSEHVLAQEAYIAVMEHNRAKDHIRFKKMTEEIETLKDEVRQRRGL